jgi:peptide-methionine (S)-S-oxide reductase
MRYLILSIFLLSTSAVYTQTLEKATFGGGCFWCVEAVFEELDGVVNVVSGYSGDTKYYSYEEVCTGRTRHAEVVQVSYDPEVIDFRLLCEVFFTTHDPTTLNRQGNDRGPQYRSVIFYHNKEQRDIAKSVKKIYASSLWDDPVVTEISPLTKFYDAEKYHQDFYANNENYGYCRVIINPKLSKFRKKFKPYLKASN